MYIYAMAFLMLSSYFFQWLIFLTKQFSCLRQQGLLTKTLGFRTHHTISVTFVKLFVDFPYPSLRQTHYAIVHINGLWRMEEEFSGILVSVFAFENKSSKTRLFVWHFFFWIPLKRQRNDQNRIPQPSLAGLWHEVLFILAVGICWRVF